MVPAKMARSCQRSSCAGYKANPGGPISIGLAQTSATFGLGATTSRFAGHRCCREALFGFVNPPGGRREVPGDNANPPGGCRDMFGDKGPILAIEAGDMLADVLVPGRWSSVTGAISSG